ARYQTPAEVAAALAPFAGVDAPQAIPVSSPATVPVSTAEQAPSFALESVADSATSPHTQTLPLGKKTAEGLSKGRSRRWLLLAGTLFSPVIPAVAAIVYLISWLGSLSRPGPTGPLAPLTTAMGAGAQPASQPAQPDTPASTDWFVLLRSADPSIWNDDVNQ